MTKRMTVLALAILLTACATVSRSTVHAAEIIVAKSGKDLADTKAALKALAYLDAHGIDLHDAQAAGLPKEVAERLELLLVIASRMLELPDNPTPAQIEAALPHLKNVGPVYWTDTRVSCDNLAACRTGTDLLCPLMAGAAPTGERLLENKCRLRCLHPISPIIAEVACLP